jgi:CRISPR-associated protein Cas2
LTVIVVTRVTAALRGKLTRWMLEIHAGVFIGTLSTRVRDRLWALVTGSRRLGACTIVSRTSNEQGFTMRSAGDPARSVVDYDGLLLLRRPAVLRRRRREAPAP